jgi:hypothetical protein
MHTATAWFLGSLLVTSLFGPSLAFPASLDSEAQEFFRRSFEAIFIKCGDSHFTKWYPMASNRPPTSSSSSTTSRRHSHRNR